MLNARTARSLFVFALAILHSPDLEGERTALAHQDSANTVVFGRALDFIENRGQWDGPAMFAASLGRNLAASLEPGGVALRMGGESPVSLRLLFEGASAAATIVGEQKRRGVYNFFVGNDPRRWQSRRAL